MGVRTLRERLGIAPFDPAATQEEMITMDEAALRLGICIGSVRRLVQTKILPATQVMRSAPWQIPAAALQADAVQRGVRAINERRSVFSHDLQQAKILRLPGL